MFSRQVLAKVRHHYPYLKIGHKDQSPLMRTIGKMLFFYPSFMTHEATSCGNTIYFPNQSFINRKRISSIIFLLHELVHSHNKKKTGKLVFYVSYLFPQILLLPILVLFWVLPWFVVLPIILILAAPIPAPFRMKHEKKSYLASLYCIQAINQKHNYHIDVQAQSDFFVAEFNHLYYYKMWPYPDIKQDFKEAMTKIENGHRPYQDEIFDVLDDILREV
jgi:hypothetical protein